MSRKTESDSKTPGGAERLLGPAALVVALLLPALLVYLWSRPMAAISIETPPLALSPVAIRDALARDARLAGEAPDDETAQERRRIYQEANVAEHEADDYPGRARERVRRLMAALHRMEVEHGEDVVAKVRAQDVARAERALAGELAAGDVISELGGFASMMERYGMARGGTQTAPRVVVHAALAARWNSVHGRELTDGLDDVLLGAYWGWLALSADDAPFDLRMSALEHYEAATGERADEARGALLFAHGDTLAAAEAFGAAYDERGTFRLRNERVAAEEQGAAGRGGEAPP